MNLTELKKPILLGVNIDHCATLRQARYPREYKKKIAEPKLLDFALLCEKAGADGITMHLREDRRHVQSDDVESVKNSIKTRLNLEMACTESMLEFSLSLVPDSVCLVPEKREEITTEGGLNISKNFAKVRETISALSNLQILTSLFINPEPKQIELAAKAGAQCVELHTGAFSNIYESGKWKDSWESLENGAKLAHELGLVVNAGHGVNYNNIRIIKKLSYLNELNIGHSILSRSIFVGIEKAVKSMKNRILEIDD